MRKRGPRVMLPFALDQSSYMKLDANGNVFEVIDNLEIPLSGKEEMATSVEEDVIADMKIEGVEMGYTPTALLAYQMKKLDSMLITGVEPERKFLRNLVSTYYAATQEKKE